MRYNEDEELSATPDAAVAEGTTALTGAPYTRDVDSAGGAALHGVAADDAVAGADGARAGLATEIAVPTAPERPKTSCPYCQQSFESDDTPTVTCARCGTHYHTDCWGEAGDCAVPGCLPVPEPAPQVTVSFEPVRPEVASPEAPADWPPFGAIASDLQPATSEAPAGADEAGARRKRILVRAGAVAAVVALVVLSSVGTKLNWFSSLTGKVYTQQELDQATSAARRAGNSTGYSEGQAEGYARGRAAGYDSGLAAGRLAGYTTGCQSALLALSTSGRIYYYEYVALRSAC